MVRIGGGSKIHNVAHAYAECFGNASHIYRAEGLLLDPADGLHLSPRFHFGQKVHFLALWLFRIFVILFEAVILRLVNWYPLSIGIGGGNFPPL